MTKIRTCILSFAVLLAACGGAGGTTPAGATPVTNGPSVAGTEEPKPYSPGKTAKPSSSPDEYYGY
jgi:hypothetical protein